MGVRSIAQRGALDCTRASVCVCKLGICARANMSELECRPVSRIERTTCALEPSASDDY
jgi:hypothetical protein